MNFGGIFKSLFGENQGGKDASSGGEDRSLAVAKAWFDAAQSGALENGSTGIAKLYSELSPMTAPAQATPAAAPAGVAPSTMQLLQPPSASPIAITPPSGTKPGNYTPAQISFMPQGPSALVNLGLLPAQTSPFQITLPKGTKPKNYQPATMTVRPPTPVGADAMMQVLAAMQPVSPFGTRMG